MAFIQLFGNINNTIDDKEQNEIKPLTCYMIDHFQAQQYLLMNIIKLI